MQITTPVINSLTQPVQQAEQDGPDGQRVMFLINTWGERAISNDVNTFKSHNPEENIPVTVTGRDAL